MEDLRHSPSTPDRKPVVRPRTPSLSAPLSSISSSPAKFRVASGRGDFAADGAATGLCADVRLAGWTMVQHRERWKRRFLEIDAGVVRVFNTDAPVNINVERLTNVVVNVSVAEDGRSVLEVSSVDASQKQRTTLLCLSSDKKARICMIARCVLAGVCGEDSQSFLTTVQQQQQQQQHQQQEMQDVLIAWSSRTLSVFRKTFKRAVELRGLQVQTSQTRDADDRELQLLAVANAAGERLAITVPDQLLLLQWCGALTSCDVAPPPKAERVVDTVFKQMVEDASAPVVVKATRSNSLGLTAALGADANADDAAASLPKKANIKQEMLEAEVFPATTPGSMKELLANAQLRRWVFMWARTQYCGENVKFVTACEYLRAETSKEQRAAGLTKVAAEFIATDGRTTVNIGGPSRKAILRKISNCNGNVDELSALIPSVLEGAVDEITRVLEFDLYPQFKMLMDEVIVERASAKAAGAASPPSVPARNSSQTSAAPLSSSAGSNSTPSSPPDSLVDEYASLSANSSPVMSVKAVKSVRDVMYDSRSLQELLLFCSGTDQMLIMFVTLVAQYKTSDENVRRHLSMNIFRKYCDPQSETFINLLSDRKLKQLSRTIAEKVMAPPANLFDAQLQEVCNLIDSSGLFRKFWKAKKQQRSKKSSSLLIKGLRGRSTSVSTSGSSSGGGGGGGANQ